MHKTLITRELKEKLEDDRWQFIEIKTDIYSDLGYIVGGKEFVLEEERSHQDSISKSVLMDRSMKEIEKTQPRYNKEEYSSRFKINPSYITLGNLKFKIVSSTEHMIKVLRMYLELNDEIPDKSKKFDLLGKFTELILMYNEYIKDLILKGEAVKLDRIKTKSITAKHLIICYLQLQLIDALYTGDILQRRTELTKDNFSGMHKKMGATQEDIRKKYQKIIELRIMSSIETINTKDENWLENEHVQSIPKNIQSSIELFHDLMLSEDEF